MKVHVLVVAALVVGCGEDKCPAGLKANGPDNCLVPGGEAGRVAVDAGTTRNPLGHDVVSRGAGHGGHGGRGDEEAGVVASAGVGGAIRMDRVDGADGGRGGVGGAAGMAGGIEKGGGGSAAGRGGAGGMGAVDAAPPAGQVAPPPTPRCGDSNVDPGELCDGHCPESCDDGDPCTKDSLTGSDCSVRCVYSPIGAGAADGCCPDGATSLTDSDCSVSCGNGVVEAGESCDGDCPTTCNDGDSCTSDRLVGSAARCTAECVSIAITSPANSDGCCPKSANATNDNDCKPRCGNGVVEAGESCDGSCPTKCTQDNDPCTVNELVGEGCGVSCKVKRLTRTPAGNCNDGKECTDDVAIESTSQCIFICKHEGRSAGTPCGGGGKCSGTLANSCDVPPPAVCGDGIQQAGEACDDGGETWECDRNCRLRNLFTACSATSECGSGERCFEGACTVECGLYPDGLVSCPAISFPAPALGELTCWIVAESKGWCRPRCERNEQCPRGMHCYRDSTGGACFPG